MSEKEYFDLKKWSEEHICAHLYDLGLLETYIFMFDCDTCPSTKLVRAYKTGLDRIKLIANGKQKYRTR